MGCNQSTSIQAPSLKRIQSLSLYHSQIFSSPKALSQQQTFSQSAVNSRDQSAEKPAPGSTNAKRSGRTNLIQLLKSKPQAPRSYNQISFKLQQQDSIIETEEPSRKRVNLIELLKSKQRTKELSQKSQEDLLQQQPQSSQIKSISTIKRLSQKESSFIVDSNELSKLSFEKYSIRLVEKSVPIGGQTLSVRQLPTIQELGLRKSCHPKSTYLSPMDQRFNRQYSRTAMVMQTLKLEKSVDEKGNKKINDYIVVSPLGQGGFGKVKKVYCQKRKQYFATKSCNKLKLKHKLLSKTKSAYTFLQQEIAILKKMDHPNIVKLIEVIDDPNHNKLYLVMEFIEWGCLNSKIYWKKVDSTKFDNQGDLKGPPRIESEQKLKRYFRQFLLGLEYPLVVHNVANVIHRDIKPDNLLITSSNNLKIGDFGVALLLDQDIQAASDAGTKAYMAPEYFLNKRPINWKACDIWAAGVTFYHLFSGNVPFRARNLDELRSQVINSEQSIKINPSKTSPCFPEDMADDFKDLLQQCLEKDPARRISLEGLMV